MRCRQEPASSRRRISACAATLSASREGTTPALADLSGDEGAKSILAAHRDGVRLIEVDDGGVVRDVDAPGDLGP